MRHKFLIAALLALVACEPSVAENDVAPQAGAAELLVNGKPADPICFAPYLMREDAMESISLDPATCAPGHVATTKDYRDIPGYIGTGFTMSSDPEAQGMRPAFIAYRVIGVTPENKVALQLTGSGGGTGVFSTLLTAIRMDNALTNLKTYAGGDRCNAGLVDASMTRDGTLAFSVNATPYDFLNLGGVPQSSIQAYDDIDACAACCFALARYEEETFVGVTLNNENPPVEQPNDKTVQKCFDEIMSRQDKTEWTAAEYAPLRDQLRKECAIDE